MDMPLNFPNITIAQGQNIPGPEEVDIPPTAELPTHTFRPGLTKAKSVFEINPLLLYRRSFSVEGESVLKGRISLGARIEFYDNQVWSSGGNTASLRYMAVAPNVRLYVLEHLEGGFLGLRVFIGSHYWKASVNGDTLDKQVFTLSPTAHVGYRFTSHGGLTVAGYLGAGFHIPDPKWGSLSDARANQENWNNARSAVNDGIGGFKPDIGLTVGIAF